MNTKVSLFQGGLQSIAQAPMKVWPGEPARDVLPNRLPQSLADLGARLPPADIDHEYFALDQESIGDWIESQLLDCQNLARQHGLQDLATLLDKALDLLAQGTAATPAAGENASAVDPTRETVPPIRAWQWL